MVVISLALIAGIISLNKSNKDPIIIDNSEDKNMDIEKQEVNIPTIKAKDNPENNNVLGLDYDSQDMDVEIKINPITNPSQDKLPEEMEKPITEPKPTEQPKPIEEEINDKEKPPTTVKEEPKEIKSGTDKDGVVRNLEGNPTGLKPAENVEEIKGSDLLPEGKKAGEGDKF